MGRVACALSVRSGHHAAVLAEGRGHAVMTETAAEVFRRPEAGVYGQAEKRHAEHHGQLGKQVSQGFSPTAAHAATRNSVYRSSNPLIGIPLSQIARLNDCFIVVAKPRPQKRPAG